MKLIGMLDSPYVRRTAITFRLLGVDFEHQALSVFRGYDEFRGINPVVKAPTLILDDGTVLMDSTLIIDHVEAIVGRSLMPTSIVQRQRDVYLIGLALAACEKSVQIVYERNLRPAEKQHEPWIARVREQLFAAYAALENALKDAKSAWDVATVTQGAVTIAVAWQFTQLVLPDEVRATDFPNLAEFSAQAELLDAFKATPQI